LYNILLFNLDELLFKIMVFKIQEQNIIQNNSVLLIITHLT
jgi:hypothetical protein